MNYKFQKQKATKYTVSWLYTPVFGPGIMFELQRYSINALSKEQF